MPKIHAALVTATEAIAPGVIQVTLAFTDKFEFKPGQYVSVHFRDGVSRAYCIASAPQRPQAVQIAVRLGRGPGSEALRDLKVGERVEVEAAQGKFTIPDGDRRDVVFVAGDVGLAPVRSIVLHLRATGDPRTITVIYDPADANALFAGDFQKMGDAGSIRFIRGPVEETIPREKATIANALVMATGFDPFLERATRQLEAAGVDRARVVTESFGRI
ncbi:MAG TPA: FAD-dependent oxidoreductase [Thermoanaerobaculia bacterium]|nr:FAD-dependent oxidoreductase [Thermoanaerobaculia bacterium]